MAKEISEPAAIDYKEIDELIHGRVRLAIMAYLSGAGSADFTLLRNRLKVTDGNLSVNIRKLEDAGYIRVEKKFADRRPLTICRLTRKGRNAWIAYIDNLDQIIRAGEAP